MLSDCPEAHGSRLELPKPITGLNLWPDQNVPLSTRQLYDCLPEEERTAQKPIQTIKPILCANNRGVRRGTFVVNPEWVSEDVSQPPRALGAVYEPQPSDFHEARAYHARTWEQAATHPEHGSNPHHMIPGYAPYKHDPVHLRHGYEDIANRWPWVTHHLPSSAHPSMFLPTAPHTPATYDRAIEAYNGRLLSRHRASSARVTRRELMGEFCSRLGADPFAAASQHERTVGVQLPHPIGPGTTPELTDEFSKTYMRNLPAMTFRGMHHVAPFNAYMTFCDWGEPPLKESVTTTASLPAILSN